MTPWLKDADVTLYHGDALATLREFPAESVDSVVTSPPYWGLRDYGQEGQLGLEPSPEQYVERMVEVFREVRRVLAAHGTVWLNLGDSYNADHKQRPRENMGLNIGKARTHENRLAPGLKPKDLVGIPWRVAFALQADGWYLRSDIIWAKPNPMPESVTDRPTKAHEYVFLLSKQARYFFDQEAVREAFDPKWKAAWEAHPKTAIASNPDAPQRSMGYTNGGGVGYPDAPGRNIRSVWEIATQPYPEAHFATFPEELARRCIAAGCPEQVCRVCGRAREREVDISYTPHGNPQQHNAEPNAARGSHGKIDGDLDGTHGGPQSMAHGRATKNVQTLGFTDCGHADYRPGIVLDPFIGSGTVAFVARKLGRHSIGIDLSAEYLALAARRLQQQSLLAEVT